MTARFRTFSQAPQAVRSAGGRRWDRALPAGAPAGGTLQTDKCDALGLTVQVHRFRNISSTAAIRAVVRSHSSPPSLLKALSTTCGAKFAEDCFALRITNKNWRAMVRTNRLSSRSRRSRARRKTHDHRLGRGSIAPQRDAADRNQYIGFRKIGRHAASGNLVRH